MSLDDRSGRIDHRKPELLWRQVAADIRADIESGALQPDARLPSEPELSAQYGVSRVTVRRALGVLAEEGLVIVLHGRGTFVRDQHA